MLVAELINAKNILFVLAEKSLVPKSLANRKLWHCPSRSLLKFNKMNFIRWIQMQPNKHVD